MLLAADSADPEPSERAAQLQAHATRFGRIVCPAIAAHEVAAVLLRWSKQGRPVAPAAVHAALMQGVESAPENASSALELAARSGLHVFDASYLEIAIANKDAVLVTNDAQLLQAGIAQLGAKRAFTSDGAFRAFVEGSA